ncbi:MAG: tRNA preQ1(34) S-adenosylmethionine ribosyltransferase-isomerase QueA [Alphaproteobacteria bacterium]|nr:tRNA preQ1(34) S-adenosylmethionine ribosyltransferase-isomerase QueA [Alphaproteobacteria bacterium]
MKVDLFDFDLPEERIAQEPVSPRDSARMLDLTDAGTAHRIVRDLPGRLEPGDMLVVNDTKVIPARLSGRRAGPDGGARMEVTLHKRLSLDSWRVFARPARKLRLGDRFETAVGLTATVTWKGEAGEAALQFDRSGEDLMTALHRDGQAPLPPYIKRGADDPRGAADKTDYQTLFAEKEGAVAAPTASLHYTDALVAAIEARGVTIEKLTLHVGAGTFLPVKVADTDDHIMHAEIGVLSAETADALNTAKARGGRIVASGTTSLRLLESAARADGRLDPFDGETDLFITPGYRFKAVDRLLTNFHLPRSTLFMLVCAFAGTDRMKRAYAEAIEAGYRFYSYGDCCLLERSAAP